MRIFFLLLSLNFFLRSQVLLHFLGPGYSNLRWVNRARRPYCDVRQQAGRQEGFPRQLPSETPLDHPGWDVGSRLESWKGLVFASKQRCSWTRTQLFQGKLRGFTHVRSLHVRQVTMD